MAGQSLAMGEAFGKGFQYGKRKISSMSNEEFNALDFKQLSESIHTDYKTMIPSLTQSIRESKVLQDAVFDALGKVILDIPPAILGFFEEAGRVLKGETTTSTSASLLGSEITEVRSGGRQVTINEQAILDAQKIIDQAVLDAKALLSPFQTDKTARDQSNADRLEQERLIAAARARTAEEARTKAQQLALEKEVARAGVVTSRRKAGQSQIAERQLLINRINQYANLAKGASSAAKRQSWLGIMTKFQASLTILLQRYIF